MKKFSNFFKKKWKNVKCKKWKIFNKSKNFWKVLKNFLFRKKKWKKVKCKKCKIFTLVWHFSKREIANVIYQLSKFFKRQNRDVECRASPFKILNVQPKNKKICTSQLRKKWAALFQLRESARTFHRTANSSHFSWRGLSWHFCCW